MRTQHCVFCGVMLQPSRLEHEDSRTKEHVYGCWFRGSVVHDNIKLFTASDEEPPILHRKVHLEKFINGSVCRQCNTGWMSGLEGSIDPIIDKLTSGMEIKALSVEEVETMARWTAKTAIVLSAIMPIPVVVPEFIRRSLLPGNGPPQLRCFYAGLKTDLTLEAAFYQLRYGEDIPVVGGETAVGLRFTLCVFGHLLTVDFPPMIEGVRYDLSESCNARIWPSFLPAGTNVLRWAEPQGLDGILRSVCKSIHARYDLGALRT